MLAAGVDEESMVSVLRAIGPFHLHADTLEDGYVFGFGMEHNDSVSPIRDELTELLTMGKGKPDLRAAVVQRLLDCVEPTSRWSSPRVYTRLSLRESKDAHSKLPGVERATIEQLTRQFESSVLIRAVVRSVEVLFRRDGPSLMDDHGRLRDMVTKAWLAERNIVMSESGARFFNFKDSGALPRIIRRVQTRITDELLERDSSESEETETRSARKVSSSSSGGGDKKKSSDGSDDPPPGPNFDLNNMKDRDKLQLALLVLMGLYFALRSQPDRSEAGAQRVEDAGGATSPAELPLAPAQFARITQRQFQRDLAPLVLGLDPTSSRSAAAAAAGADDGDSLLTHGVPNNRLVVSVDAKNRVAYVYDPHVGVAVRPPGSRDRPYAWSFTFGSIDAVESLFDEIAADLGAPQPLPVSYMSSDRMDMTRMAMSWLPVLILIGGSFYMSRALSKMGGGAGGRGGMGGLFGVGKASNALVKETAVKTKFSDVAGLQEAKDEILEFVDFLKNPEKFERLGARVPRGALLAGPPGTGKTLLARAVAGEAKVPFFSMSGSDFTEMFVGVGPARVRDLFKQAREAAPCIVFLDEIDAVGRARRKSGFASSDERENTLNQMLVELDGFASKDAAPIVVLAGTNRPDVLDPALMRPGRFDRQISVDLPDSQGRRDILLVHLKPLKLARSTEATDGDVADQAELRLELADKLCHMTSGFSGADLANLCNEAALRTARRNGTGVCVSDFDGALDRVVAGLERRSRVLSEEERRTVAFHEAGHALAGYFLKGCDPLLRLTIVPRGAAALGYAMYSPLDRRLVTRDQLMDRLCMTLGGRCAEEVAFDNVITTGASDDLDKATKMAYEWVTSLGFTEALGLASYPRPSSDDEAMFYERPYSQATSRLIDSEVKKLMELAYTTTKNLLIEHRHHMDVLANALLDRETLTGEDMPALLGPRPSDVEAEAEHAASEEAKKEKDAKASADSSSAPAAETNPTPVS
jgi:AFG3 family protein